MRLSGLVAATHTPFSTDGELNLAVVAKQAEHLLRIGVRAAFVGGTTGESHSLSIDERMQLAERWSDVVRGSNLKLIVHVGTNCIRDAKTLAVQAQSLGAVAISALAPSYFKPKSIELLIDCCAEIAGAAPGLPFYYYDIPSLTGVSFSMPEFLVKATEKIPNLAGLKFTNTDLVAYQKCLQVNDGRFDLPWGVDECLLAALAFGATGAVGSTYNFAAPIYHRVIRAFEAGDFELARANQLLSVRLVDLLAGFGYMGAAKQLMTLLGVDVGPPRLPNSALTESQCKRLREELVAMSFSELCS